MKTVISPILLVGALAAVLGAGCITKEVPAASDCDAGCEVDAPPMACSTTGPDLACDVDQPVCNGSTCGPCTGPNDCANRGEADVCTPSGACGACAEIDVQDPTNCQTAGLEVCDGASHACRACAADSECSSDWCEDGTCVAADEIAYVAPPSTATSADCTQAGPCSTMVAALDTSRPYIVVAAGTYDAGNDDIDINNQDVKIRAAGATFKRTGTGPVVNVHGSSDVVILGGIVDGAGHSGDNIVCTMNTTLALLGTTVTGSDANGVNADCALTVHEATISANALVGIAMNASNKPLELLRSTLLSNRRSAATLTVQRATIINNYIIKNGVDGSISAFKIDAVADVGVSRIEFNTIAGNVSDPTTNGAVSCGAGNIALKNSIIYGNNGAGVEVNGCAVTYSTVEGGYPGTGNITVVPTFVATGTNDFRLVVGSELAGKADPATILAGPTAVDNEGEVRPQGDTIADVGADEIP